MNPLAAVLLATGSAALLALAYNTLVARQLGPVAYAEFATGLAAATMLAYAGGALAPITAHLSARYMAGGEPEKIRGLVATLLRRFLPLLIAGAIAAALLAVPIAGALRFSSAISVIVAYGVLAGLLVVSVARAAWRGAQQFGQFGISVAGEALVRLIAGAALLALWPAPAAALAGYVAGLIVVFAWTFRGLQRLSPVVAAVPRADVTGLLGTTTALVVAMAAFQNLDILVVKRAFAPAEAGIYAAAWSFARWMALVAFPIEALLLPRLTFAGDRGQSVVAVAARLGGSLVALGVVPLALFALVPLPIVTVLYGAEYRDAAPLLFALGLAAFAQYGSYLAAQVLISRSQSWPVALFAAMGAAETVIIVMRHDSLAMVATILVAARLTTLIAILIGTWATARPRVVVRST
ncbi:MAG: lipopolysaccharide biosynthesis protein [Vicinamibacterales bacterium]